jgi:hypothetical protein
MTLKKSGFPKRVGSSPTTRSAASKAGGRKLSGASTRWEAPSDAPQTDEHPGGDDQHHGEHDVDAGFDQLERPEAVTWLVGRCVAIEASGPSRQARWGQIA